MLKAEYILLRQYVSEPPIASPLGRRSSEGAKLSGRADRETGGGSPTVREGVIGVSTVSKAGAVATGSSVHGGTKGPQSASATVESSPVPMRRDGSTINN